MKSEKNILEEEAHTQQVVSQQVKDNYPEFASKW